MNKNIVDQHYLESAMNAAATRTYRLAARHGLSSAEREDIEQSILLELLERYPQYDPAKGSMNTFTGIVSEHRAVELLDQLMKQRIRMTVLSSRLLLTTLISMGTQGGVQEAKTLYRSGPMTGTFSGIAKRCMTSMPRWPA